MIGRDNVKPLMTFTEMKLKKKTLILGRRIKYCDQIGFCKSLKDLKVSGEVLVIATFYL